MDRRNFLKLLIAGGAGTLFDRALAQKLFDKNLIGNSLALPPPVVNTYSTEICLNSRLSYHSGYSGALSDQILANILWACSKAPLVGANSTIYVARSDNVYRYDPVAHDIIVHRTGNHMSEANTAFEVGVASDLAEDAGAALHFGHLAAISFWTSTSNQPSCCPKESGATNANSRWNPVRTVQIVNCYGFMRTVSGITSQLVAQSSNGSLPDPSTNGTVLLENALNNLKYDTQFAATELTLQQISQLAWASYGNTPHTAVGKGAITVASAVANYYMTGRIYIVRSVGVERYHIRLPSGQQNTRDHRIERVTTGDRRSQLRSAVSRLPQSAPNYFVFCAAQATRWQLIEAGYCGSSALLQASSIDLQGYFTANFNSSERTAIQNALGIPAADLPLFIFSAGQPASGVEEKPIGGLIYLEAEPNPFREKVKIHYSIAMPAHVQLKVYDVAGKPVRTLVNRPQQKGSHTISWNGTDNKGKLVPKGNYFYILRLGEHEFKKKIVRL